MQVDIWIETGFTGDPVLLKSLDDVIELEVTGSIDGFLADGSQVELSTFHCQTECFGRIKDLEVIAKSGQTPLLGVGLLIAKELRIDSTNQCLTPKPKRSAF